MNDENKINIDGMEVKEFEINELLPSLRFYENKLIQSVKESADENLKTEKKVVGES